jgi:hypothetical protein
MVIPCVGFGCRPEGSLAIERQSETFAVGRQVRLFIATVALRQPQRPIPLRDVLD